MKNNNNKYTMGFALGGLLTAGALVAGLFQIPSTIGLSTLSQGFSKLPQTVADGAGTITAPIANIFFGQSAHSAEAVQKITDEKAFVSSRDAYDASLAVIKRHADEIKTVAAAHNVPEDVAIGVAFLENGGSETAKSPAGALGIYQLMPSTARNLGLTVNRKVDERKDPEKSIEAGVSYLASNYDRFGDWGLATWAYHAGEGNVAKALKIYAEEHDGITLPGVENSAALHDYVTSHQITINTLLSDPGVQQFTDKLHDDTAGYPYKVIATASLFRESADIADNGS